MMRMEGRRSESRQILQKQNPNTASTPGNKDKDKDESAREQGAVGKENEQRTQREEETEREPVTEGEQKDRGAQGESVVEGEQKEPEEQRAEGAEGAEGQQKKRVAEGAEEAEGAEGAEGEKRVEGAEGEQREEKGEQREEKSEQREEKGEQGDEEVEGNRRGIPKDVSASFGPTGAMIPMAVTEETEEPSTSNVEEGQEKEKDAASDPPSPPVLIAPTASSNDWRKYIAYVALAGAVGFVNYIDRVYQKRFVTQYWKRNQHVRGRHSALAVSLILRGVFLFGSALLLASVFTGGTAQTLLKASEKFILFFVGFVVFAGAYAAFLDLHEVMVDSSLFEAQRPSPSPNRYMTFHVLVTLVLMGFVYVLWGKGRLEHVV